VDVAPSPKSHWYVIGVDPREESINETDVGTVEYAAYCALNCATGVKPTVIYPELLSDATAPGSARVAKRAINATNKKYFPNLIIITNPTYPLTDI